MKRFAALGVILAMLTFFACQPNQTSNEDSGNFSPAASSEGSYAEPITTEDLLMRDYVRVYEKYCHGLELSETDKLADNIPLSYLFGWLLENEQLERYAVYNGSSIDYYSLPLQDAQQFYKLYFGDRAVQVGSGLADINYDSSYADSTSAIEVRLESHKELENGNYQLTIRRFLGEREWYPAVYEFAPVEVNVIPNAILDKTIQRGDKVYTFVSMRNLPMQEMPNTGKMVTINTPQQLIELSELVNSGDWAYQNNVYRLAADLDMSGVTFEPIGSYVPDDFRDPAPKGFCTTFDGQEHTIKNLSIQDGEGATGLFARLGINGFVGNLKLENCNISSSTKGYPELFAPTGAIVGLMESGAINRCTVSGNISGSDSVGGLVGHMGGLVGYTGPSPSIQECRADVTVTGNKAVGGAIGGTSMGWVNECTALGEVNAIAMGATAPSAIGGYIGRIDGATIDRGIVSVEVKVHDFANQVGSFTGYNAGNLVGCFYNTDVSTGWKTIGVADLGAQYTVDLIGMPQKKLKAMGAF
ncbi:hypothetical protein V6615_13235 [Oscillospiraceae bacterium PP1C4]